MHPEERALYVEWVVCDNHEFKRDGQVYVEYAVCMQNYAEREYSKREHTNSRAIDMFWKQGAGINHVVCGYTTQVLVLLELRHVAYLQIFMKTCADSFLSDRIGFSNNARNTTKLVRPFLEQLPLFNGYGFGTIKILWKHYRLIATSNQWRH